MVIFVRQMNLLGLKRTLTLTFVCLLWIGAANAQRGGSAAWKNYQHEVAVGYGFNTLFAKLGVRDNLGFGYMIQRSSFNTSYRYYFMRHFAVRGTVSHHYARKNDKNNEEFGFQSNNLPIDYKTTMTELGGVLEYHILDESQMGRRKGRVRRARGGMNRGLNTGLSLYAGVSGNYFRPLGEFQGALVTLHPVNTDPGYDTDVSDYKRLNFYIPAGATFRLVLSENWRFGIEGGYRFGFRDYINNVSAVYYRDGNPNPQRSPYTDTDYTGGNVTFSENAEVGVSELSSEPGRRSYFFATFTLAYRFKTK